MLYLYDVWVNWFEGEEHGYHVCAFHEWRNNDKIEILEQVPVLLITEEIYNLIENSLHPLPKSLLDKVHRKAFVRKGHNRETLDYVCIVTDGRGMLVMDTVGYNVPFRKSRLIPKQEQRVFELVKFAKRKHFTVSLQKEKNVIAHNAIKNQHMYGLTRRERQLKRLLIIAINRLGYSSDKKEIVYWLSEITEKAIDETNTLAELYQSLLKAAKEGWSEKHEEVCAKIIRGNTILENVWKLEQKANQNISK